MTRRTERHYPDTPKRQLAIGISKKMREQCGSSSPLMVLATLSVHCLYAGAEGFAPPGTGVAVAQWQRLQHQAAVRGLSTGGTISCWPYRQQQQSSVHAINAQSTRCLTVVASCRGGFTPRRGAASAREAVIAAAAAAAATAAAAADESPPAGHAAEPQTVFVRIRSHAGLALGIAALAALLALKGGALLKLRLEWQAILIASGLAAGLQIAAGRSSSREAGAENGQAEPLPAEFRRFRRRYLVVHMLCFFADTIPYAYFQQVSTVKLYMN